MTKGKITCFITGNLKDDKPEEHVRQRMARSLVEEYGYAKSDIALEYVIPIGTLKPRADIVVFEKDADHTNENIILIIESKRDDIKITDKEQGVDQLKSYMTATINANYGLWVGSEFHAYKKTTSKKKIRIENILDIPFADGKLKTIHSFTDLIPATEGLVSIFKRCHNYIVVNQGFSKEYAFSEFLKIIFCKAYDEKESKEPQFYIEPTEVRTIDKKKVYERIQKLFAKVVRKYSYIFDKTEKIELNEKVSAYIVNELQKFTLLDTDFDYKGKAYEEIVGANSRGDRGEFFTPRNLCWLATSMISKLHNDNVKSLRIVDPACGTGGFLKSFINIVHDNFYSEEQSKWKDITKIKTRTADRLRDYCNSNVCGIEFNPVLVKASQMNLFMHGDGSTNVFHDNSLLSSGEQKEKTRQVVEKQFDIVITNPPFGSELLIDDAHVLSQYELSTFESNKQRKSMQPQDLFVEKCYSLLKPGGILGIILPNNILTNPDRLYIRKWILMKYKIIASISMPVETFQPSTGTSTSLLIMRKKETPDTFETNDEPYDIFLGIANKVGHDARGFPIPKRDENGNIVYQDRKTKSFVRKENFTWEEKILINKEIVEDDDIPKIFDDFCEWLNGESTFHVSINEILDNECRMDAGSYSSNVMRAKQILINCEKQNIPIKTIGEFSKGTFNPPPIKRIFTDDSNIGTPYVIPQELSDFIFEPKKLVIKSQMKDVKDWFVKEDWIVLTQSGTVGKPYYTLKNDSEYVLSQNAIRIPPKEKKYAGFVYAYLSSWIGQALLTKNEFGVTVKHIRPTHVNNIPIPDIDDDKKEKISKMVKKAYRHRKLANKLLKDAEVELFASLNVDTKHD